MLNHKHFLLTGKTTAVKEGVELWVGAAISGLSSLLKDIVYEIKMVAMIEPVVLYCDTPGNEGITGFIVIETSHISFHWWQHTGLLQLDVYSCADFDPDVVIELVRNSLVDEKLDILSTHIIDRNP
jgi:S-adenosylmethionine decarboxylase